MLTTGRAVGRTSVVAGIWIDSPLTSCQTWTRITPAVWWTGELAPVLSGSNGLAALRRYFQNQLKSPFLTDVLALVQPCPWGALHPVVVGESWTPPRVKGTFVEKVGSDWALEHLAARPY